MDLRFRTNLFLPLLLFISIPALAIPKLRLDNSAIGPVSIAQGSNGPAQTINALNAGDGTLNLQAASSATWLVPSVRTVTQCLFIGPCTPVSLALNTASLARGTYTGVVTLSDPNALDAPQTVTVTVAVGGGVPDALTLYVPNNGKPVTERFTAARQVNAAVNNPSGGPVVSVALSNAGSFDASASYTYVVTATAPVAQNEAPYNGSIVVSGSSVPSENKTVPVTLNVTSKPIARFTIPEAFRVAQGSAKRTQYVFSENTGGGTLSLTGATGTAAANGSWLSASIVGSLVAITVDPKDLAPGPYQGTVSVASNAANASVTLPVQLEIVASGAPVVYYQGVKSNATFTPEILAQGDLPAVFGERFTTGDPKVVSDGPWPTSLGGATVLINDQPVPLYYVSATQINFQVPFEIPPGDAVLRVDRDGQRGNSVSVRIARSAPKLLIATNLQGAVVSSPAVAVGNGITIGGPGTPVNAGDYVVIYSLGFGPAVPAIGTGQAAPALPLSEVPGVNEVRFGTPNPFSPPLAVRPQYLGLTPGFVGLYQVNVQIPEGAPRGAAVPVFVEGEAGASNILLFNIQ